MTSRPFLIVAAVVMIAATGCLQPPAPPGPPIDNPVITSIEVSPSPAVAGEDVTMVVRASHDLGIDRMFPNWRLPNGTLLRAEHECKQASGTIVGSPDSVITLTCTLPDGAPNGIWAAIATVAIIQDVTPTYTAVYSETAIEVVGGANDQEAPQFNEIVAPPTSVAPGDAFTFTLRVSDAHPLGFVFAGGGRYPATGGPSQHKFNCAETSRTAVGPTLTDIAIRCPIDPGQAPETYLHTSTVTDTFGNEGIYNHYITVT